MDNKSIGTLVGSLVSDFFSDPAHGDDIGNWIADKLEEALPEEGRESAAETGTAIVDAVGRINDNIISLDKSIEEGGTRESYLYEAADKILGDSMGTKAKVLTVCAVALNGAAEAYDNGGKYEINGELKDYDEMWLEDNWNEYKVGDLASNVAQQAGVTALKSLASEITSGIEESMEMGGELGKEQLCAAVGTATDIGVKTAAAGALQIAFKKGYLNDALPDDTAPGDLANIAVDAVEGIKTAVKVADGTLSIEEGVDRIQRTAVARAVDFIATYGESCGEKIGEFFGPKGVVVGKVVGKALSYCAKTEARQAMIDAGNAICNCARACVKTLAKAAANAFATIKNGVMSLLA